MNTKITAKDFFLHVSLVVLLYAGTVALLNILFKVINAAYPQVTQYYYFNSSSISFPVATLIVVFPLFVFLASLVRKSYAADPSLKDYAVRKWLIYITLFIAGGVMAGDLIAVIYYFLDGQELTMAFILKVLAVFVVTGAIFGYYLDDLKGHLVGSRVNVWRAVAAILVIGSIVAGFSVLGTPQKQRDLRYDSQKVSDLQNIQWQIINRYQQKGTLPATLAELNDSISGFQTPVDPQGQAYTYRKTGNLAFELCATFNQPTPASMSSVQYPMMYPEDKLGGNWEHTQGVQCFPRTIDPQLYPVIPVRQ